MNYKDVRTKYPKFIYKNYSWNMDNSDLNVSYTFIVGEYNFSPKLVFKNINTEKVDKVKKTVDNLVFNIGLIELLSYWKAFVSSEIVIECGSLDSYQTNWWKDLLIKGMGQFFYENDIDFTDDNFITFVSSDKHIKESGKVHIEGQSLLVPVGGGKDSSVTLEILSKNFKKVSAFLLNPSIAAKDTVKIAGVDQLVVERYIDKKLLDLNEEGFPNGHTPFTALLSFTSLLMAILNDYKTIVFSNEQSSEEDNIKFLGSSINHQYSKTLDFENRFREYNEKYFSDVEYFSFLRPIYDIQIAKIFSNFDKYFSVIRSCNIGSKENKWCLNCSKCLSTYILFRPFLSSEELNGIFGEDLLKKESLQKILSELTDSQKVKPFECVGTREELQVALSMDINNKILKNWNDNNNLSQDYEEILKNLL